MAEKTNNNNKKELECTTIATVQVNGQIREDRENDRRAVTGCDGFLGNRLRLHYLIVF